MVEGEGQEKIVSDCMFNFLDDCCCFEFDFSRRFYNFFAFVFVAGRGFVDGQFSPGFYVVTRASSVARCECVFVSDCVCVANCQTQM